MSARLTALEQQCASQRQQQHNALTAVSTCLATAINLSRDRMSGSSSSSSGDIASRLPLQPSPASPPLRSSSSLSPSSLPQVASAGRLSDLCAADKAKVGKLLVTLANMRRRQQTAQTDGEEERRAEQCERRRWAAEKEQLDRQLAHSMAVLRQYQQRLEAVEEQRTGEERRRQAETVSTVGQVEEQSSEQRTAHQSSVESIDELHRLVAAQQAAITQRMDSLMQQQSTPPQPQAGADDSTEPSRPHCTRGSQRYNVETVLLRASTSAHSALPTRAAHIAISKGETLPAAVRSTAPLPLPPPNSSSTSSLSLSPHPSPSPPRPPLTSNSHDERKEGRAAREADSSDDEDEEDERVLSRCMSPVSRRIERLMTIQRGRGRTHAANTQSQSQSALIRSRRHPAVDDDDELDELLHILNKQRTPHGQHQPASTAANTSSHLSRFDSTLIDVISAVDTWR